MSEETDDMSVTADKAGQIWNDLFPVIGFIIVYNGLRLLDLDQPWLNSDSALYWGTGVLIVLTLGAIGYKLKSGEKVPPFLIISSTIIGFFGLLGILLQEKSFIYIKPTIQNLFLGLLVFGSLAIGQNIWRVMFKSIFDLPEKAWRNLAIAWGVYFIAMALWNEFLWRYYAPGFENPLVFAGITIAPEGTYEFLGITFGAKNAEGIWANWKLGNMAITLAYGAALVPYTLKHLRTEDGSGTEAAKG